jgi:hypothetical protein
MFMRVKSKCAHQVRPPLGMMQASGATFAITEGWALAQPAKVVTAPLPADSSSWREPAIANCSACTERGT